MSENIETHTTTRTVEEFDHCRLNTVGEGICSNGDEVWYEHSEHDRVDTDALLAALDVLVDDPNAVIDFGPVTLCRDPEAIGQEDNLSLLFKYDSGTRCTNLEDLRELVEAAREQAE